jgi:hypothetical protein
VTGRARCCLSSSAAQHQRFALLYASHRFPADELSEITEATLQLKDGRTARVTMHLIEGSKEEIEKTLRQSVDAFFDLHYPGI